MTRSQSSFVGLALVRLRLSVLACVWVIGLSLMAQMGVWIAATFTDVRHEVVRNAPAPALIVTSTVKHDSQAAGGIEAGNTAAINQAKEAASAGPERAISKYDSMMGMLARFASGAAMLALLVLIPLMALGVMLSAGTATPGVEHTVGAFTWSILLSLLLLPLGDFVGLPWREGAMYSYPTMTDLVDAAWPGMVRSA